MGADINPAIPRAGADINSNIPRAGADINPNISKVGGDKAEKLSFSAAGVGGARSCWEAVLWQNRLYVNVTQVGWWYIKLYTKINCTLNFATNLPGHIKLYINKTQFTRNSIRT